MSNISLEMLNALVLAEAGDKSPAEQGAILAQSILTLAQQSAPQPVASTVKPAPTPVVKSTEKVQSDAWRSWKASKKQVKRIHSAEKNLGWPLTSPATLRTLTMGEASDYYREILKPALDA